MAVYQRIGGLFYFPQLLSLPEPLMLFDKEIFQQSKTLLVIFILQMSQEWFFLTKSISSP